MRSPDRDGRDSFARAAVVFTVFALLVGQFDWARISTGLDYVPEPRLLLALLGTPLTIAWWVTLRPRPRSLRPAMPLLVALVVWVGWLILSNLWSEAPVAVGQVLGLVLVVNFALLGALAFAASPLAAFRSLAWCTWAIGTAYAVVGLAQSSTISRVSILGGGPNVYGRVTGLGLIALVALVVLGIAPRLLSLTAPLLAAATVLSGSRGAMVSLVVGFLLLLPLFRRARIRAWALVAIVAAFGLALWPFLGDSVSRVFTARIIDLTLGQGYDSGRAALQARAYEMIQARPAFGWGLGSYGWLEGIPDDYPHNMFLQSFAESGIVGLGILVAATITGFWQVLKHSRRSMANLTMASFAVTILVASQFSGSYYDTRFMWFYLACGAFVIPLDDPPTPRRPREASRERRRRTGREIEAAG